MTRVGFTANDDTHASGDSRDELASLGLAAVAAGLVVGSGGNLSARVPCADECWVTATGTWLDQLDRGSFVKVRLDGVTLGDQRSDVGAAEAVFSAAPAPVRSDVRVEPGDAPAAPDAVRPGGRDNHGGQGDDGDASRVPAPTSELALHLALYRARPDVNVVVHLHPQTVLLLDAVGEAIRLATTDHVYYLRRVATVPYLPPGTQELADEAADVARTGVDCLVLARHGCVVLADTVELAHKRVRYLEEAAQLTYHALLLGRADRLLPPGRLPRTP